MPVQSSKKSLNPQKVFIGLDVHLKQWNVCIYQGGIARKKFQQAPDADVLLKHLNSNYPDMSYYSAYEAGVCGTSVHYALESRGIANIIFNAADVSQTHKEKVRKTDAIDAAKIARSLANGELSCIHIPPQWRVADRNLIRLRSSQISDIKRMKSRIRHFLHTNGMAIPIEYQRSWSKAFFTWIYQKAAELSNTTGETLIIMADSLSKLIGEHRELNRRLIRLMQTERYKRDFDLLHTIPGIGNVTAITLLLECGDLCDFKSAEAFCAFVGLVPDMDKSDTHEGRCSMTRRRHRVLRYMLTECAWRAIHENEQMSKLYANYTRRMPTAKSIVKIANKLAKIIKFVLKNKIAYEQPSKIQ